MGKLVYLVTTVNLIRTKITFFTQFYIFIYLAIFAIKIYKILFHISLKYIKYYFIVP